MNTYFVWKFEGKLRARWLNQQEAYAVLGGRFVEADSAYEALVSAAMKG